mgnify:CR=1 FL=1
MWWEKEEVGEVESTKQALLVRQLPKNTGQHNVRVNKTPGQVYMHTASDWYSG